LSTIAESIQMVQCAPICEAVTANFGKDVEQFV